MGYVASMRLGLYRQTRDGRRVCARPGLLPWRRRWFYVKPEQEARFERRVLIVQAISFGMMVVLIRIAGDRILADPRLLVGFLLLATHGAGTVSVDRIVMKKD